MIVIPIIHHDPLSTQKNKLPTETDYLLRSQVFIATGYNFFFPIRGAHELPEALPVQDVLAGQLDPGAALVRIALLEANGAGGTHL